MAEASSPPAVIEIEEIDLNPVAEESGSSEPPVNNQVSYYSINESNHIWLIYLNHREWQSKKVEMDG